MTGPARVAGDTSSWPLPQAPTSPDGVTLVIPALDEEGGIGPTLKAARAALDRIDLPSELIVIDDGSRDRTAEIAREGGARVISHPEPGGYGMALRVGVRAASYEFVAICDADGTYPVDELPEMVETMEHYDMVVGRRTGPRYYRQALLSPLRTSFLMLTSFVTGRFIPDPNSGLRVFRRSQVLPILHRLPRGFSFTTTLTLIHTLHGRFVHYQPIAYGARIGRRKVRVLKDALRVAQTMVEVILVHNPLKMFLVVGALPVLAMAPLLAVTGLSSTGLIGVVLLAATSILVFAAGMVAVAILGDRNPR